LFHTTLIPTVLVFITVGILFSVISIRNVYLRHKKRRSPFTNKFLRGPGQSLIEKLDDLNEELFAYMVFKFMLLTGILSINFYHHFSTAEMINGVVAMRIDSAF